MPSDATAFQRIPYPNVLNVIRWKDNTPENMKWAQMSSRKIMEIVTNGNEDFLGGLKVNGYGNYGERSNKHQCLSKLKGHGYFVDHEVDRGDSASVSDKASVLFGANYPRLQQLKKVYDSEILFSKWFPIRP